MIAGKGHEDYQITGREVFHFDDKEVAREALARSSQTTVSTIRVSGWTGRSATRNDR